MTSISYVLAGASCIPIVGLYVGFYNVWKVEAELLSYRIQNVGEDALPAVEHQDRCHQLSLKGRLYTIYQK